MVVIALLSTVITGLVIWKKHQKPPLDSPEKISRTYSGQSWTVALGNQAVEEVAEPVSITFDGECSDNPEYPVFLGLIKIETADEVLYQYENCAVYRHENWNLLFITDPIRKRDWDVPERILLENYGILMVSDDWSEVFLLYMKDELGPYTGPKGEVFAGPASSKAEAVAIAERLSANNIYKDDSWD